MEAWISNYIYSRMWYEISYPFPDLNSCTVEVWVWISKFNPFSSLAFVRGIHRWPVNSPHEGTVTRKMFPFDEVIINALRKKKRGNVKYTVMFIFGTVNVRLTRACSCHGVEICLASKWRDDSKYIYQKFSEQIVHMTLCPAFPEMIYYINLFRDSDFSLSNLTSLVANYDP